MERYIETLYIVYCILYISTIHSLTIRKYSIKCLIPIIHSPHSLIYQCKLNFQMEAFPSHLAFLEVSSTSPNRNFSI